MFPILPWQCVPKWNARQVPIFYSNMAVATVFWRTLLLPWWRLCKDVIWYYTHHAWQKITPHTHGERESCQSVSVSCSRVSTVVCRLAAVYLCSGIFPCFSVVFSSTSECVCVCYRLDFCQCSGLSEHKHTYRTELTDFTMDKVSSCSQNFILFLVTAE